MNRRELIGMVMALTVSAAAGANENPIVETKTSFFGEQPGDKEGSIVVQNIHADGSYSLSEQIFQEDYV